MGIQIDYFTGGLPNPIMKKTILSLLLPLLALSPLTWAWQSSNEQVPLTPQEFRAVWIASVHNLDWPSKPGLSSRAQQSELLSILNKCAQLKINAIFLQVRPNADALYSSRYEPWSQWLNGSGVNPGYDPLAFAITQAHARGIEVHAWFNPFRAKANVNHHMASNHISLRRPDLMKRSGSVLLSDPGKSATRQHTMNVIMDVVKRYNIDGVHLDDYFYPYPAAGRAWSARSFPDGLTPSQRRDKINDFVSELYSNVKSEKPWVRVGISPFGIWRPGVPNGIEAGVDAYEHLACDAKKWIEKGWVDYLAPQLYWRCQPQKQSFPLLMKWWAAQNTRRPIWPGIATARIQSSEDPGRPASEIARQIQYSRSLAQCPPGQCFWSVNSILKNKGGIQSQLQQLYPSMAVPPPMPWSGKAIPARPTSLNAKNGANGVTINWQAADKAARKWVVMARNGRLWTALCILPGNQTTVTLPHSFLKNAQSIGVRAVGVFGDQGPAATVTQ